MFWRCQVEHLSKAVQSFQRRVVCSFCIHWLVCMGRHVLCAGNAPVSRLAD